MRTNKPLKEIAKECAERAAEVASEGDREQLLQISKRIETGSEPPLKDGRRSPPFDLRS